MVRIAVLIMLAGCAPAIAVHAAYPSRVPRCRTGYEVVPVDTPWPFVAELPWH